MNDGRVVSTAGKIQEQTTSSNHEDLLLDHLERFAFATEAAQIGYWFCDLPFDKLIWDERVKEHFWLPHNADVDINLFYSRLHPDDRERTRRAIEESISTRTRYDIEYRTVSPQGQIKWIRAIGRTAYEAGGQPVRFDGVTREITPLKEAEESRDRAKEALRRNEKLALVGRLAATVAHEINNPLAAVTNLLYLIEQSATDSSTLGYAKLAREEVARASQIVSQTLRFNRESDRRSWERVSNIVDSALALYDVRLRQSGILLRRDYIEGDRLFCYPSGLRQVFANLIANAIDALPCDGRLIVRLRRQSHLQTRQAGFRVSFADSGHGMDRETLRRLFQPFVSTKGDEGTGLGLWVSREILDKHNATIRVRSRQTLGMSGTVFSIWIPEGIAEDPNQPAAQ